VKFHVVGVFVFRGLGSFEKHFCFCFICDMCFLCVSKFSVPKMPEWCEALRHISTMFIILYDNFSPGKIIMAFFSSLVTVMIKIDKRIYILFSHVVYTFLSVM